MNSADPCYREYVSNRALVFVGIAAVLLNGVFPGSDACTLSPTTDHACCAEPTQTPTTSCCSEMDAGSDSADLAHEVGCDCVHPSSTPITMAAFEGLSIPDELASPVRILSAEIHESSTPGAIRCTDLSVRTHPPPPAFLLDCVFLT